MNQYLLLTVLLVLLQSTSIKSLFRISANAYSPHHQAKLLRPPTPSISFHEIHPIELYEIDNSDSSYIPHQYLFRCRQQLQGRHYSGTVVCGGTQQLFIHCHYNHVRRGLYIIVCLTVIEAKRTI